MKLKVKTFIAFIGLILGGLFAQAQSSVFFNFTDPQWGLTQTTNRYVILQAENGPSLYGNVVLLPFKLTGYTDTNGYICFSNLYGGPTSGYYHWTVPAPPQMAQGDIWVSSTNLGLVNGGSLGVAAGSPYPPGAWSWTAQVSDTRYALANGTNSFTNLVTIPYLNTVSNQIVGLIPSTNGFTSIVYSNPAVYALWSVTNLIPSTNGLAPLVTVTNVAYLAAQQATNGFITSPTNINWKSITNPPTSAYFYGIIPFANLPGSIVTNYQTGVNLNGVFSGTAGSVSNLNYLNITNPPYIPSTNLFAGFQNGSLTLTNLSATGAFTNLLVAGQNVTLTTNAFGIVVYVNATNQTFLTNGFTSIVFSSPSAYLAASVLPALTNGFVTSSVTNGLASIQLATNAVYNATNLLQSGAYAPAVTTNGFVTVAYVQAGFDTNGAAKTAYSNATNSTVGIAQNVATNLTTIFDGISGIVADFSNRTLNRVSGGSEWPSVNWGTRQLLLSPSAGGVQLDWSSDTLYGNWTVGNISGGGGNVTNLNYLNITNPPVIPSTNGFVTSSITNGFLTTNQAALTYYPTSNPSAFVTSSITNGFATQSFALTIGQNATNYVNLQYLYATNYAYTNLVAYADTNGAGAYQAKLATNGINTMAYQSITNYPTLVQSTNIALSIVSSNGIGAVTATNIANSLILTATNNYNVIVTNIVYSYVTNFVITGPTNATAPTNTSLIQAWANFTNSSGGVFKLPLYH